MSTASDKMQDTSLEQIIEQVRELTQQIAGHYLTDENTEASAALANLDILLVQHLQQQVLADSEAKHTISHDVKWVSKQTQELLHQLGIELETEQESLLHFHTGKQYRRSGAWNQALEEYQKAVSITQETGQISLQAHSLKEIGHIYSEQSAWDAASEAYQQASELYHRVGDENSMGEIMKNLAINCFHIGEYEQALEHAHHVLDVAQRLEDTRLGADIHNLLGAIHDARGDLDHALTYYQRCLLHYEQIDDPAGLAQSYHNLGMTYMKRQEWQDAGEAYEHCLHIAREYENQHILASVYFNRALLYFNLHDTLMAKTYCQESIQIFETLEFRRGLANGYKLLGMIQSRTRAYTDAERFFRVAARLCEEIQNIHTLAEVCEEWAGMEQQREQFEKARSLLQRTLELYTQLQAVEPARRVEERINTLPR